MARIPAEVVERLKADVSVQRLAEARGVVLSKRGADLHGRCPFHEDRTPSLVITPAKNLWHCLGACQAGGTAIDWVMKAEGISFRHAVELLQNDYQPVAAVAADVPPAKHSTVKRLPMPIEPDTQDTQLLVQVIEYYHETLLGSPEAQEYLTRRGIASEEAIRTFKLGFANRTLGYRLPATNRVEGAAVRGRLQRLGLLRASGHEHFNGSVVVPILAPSGEVTEIYGRKITEGLRPGTPLHLYLPGPHRGVWNAAALCGAAHGTPEVILCEALIDALTFWCAGYRNVTASYGVEGFTADHLALFKQCGTQRVLIAYDRDEAGDRAAQGLAQQLLAEGLDCYRILFPKGMDANEYALKVTPAAKSLGLAIRKAQWLGRGEVQPIHTAVSVPQAVAAAESEAAKVEIPTPVLRTAHGLHPAPAVRQQPEAVPMTEAVQALPGATLPASPVPSPPTAPIEAQVTDEEVVMVLGDRRYRVRGLKKNLAFDVMLKVNVLIARGEAFHVDTLDLYSVRARGSFITQAATELKVHEEVIRHDLGQVLRKLESLQERAIEQTLTPKDPVLAIPQEEAQEALALLKDPKLLERILTDFTRCGVVGEETNKLIGYLAATSRKLEAPLAVMVRSSSAAGKSSLMEAVLAFMPAEDKVQYSAMTGQSLFYMGAMNLKHKILALAEEEGAARASYALKLLQSEGVLSIASTGKDPGSGKLVTQEYRVEGPVMIFSTTTAIDHDEELLNRCLTLGVDESREQTRAIHQLQRRKRTLEGLFARQAKSELLKQHQNAQRLLKPLAVRNPYADALTFPDERTRLRRDHEKYLTLIDTIALLHQHQRVRRTAHQEGQTIEYVEVTLEDIEVANRLAHEALGRSLDELSPQTRRLLDLVTAMVDEACKVKALPRAAHRFSRRDVREYAGWSDFQVKMHSYSSSYTKLWPRPPRCTSTYSNSSSLCGAGKDGQPFLMGLIDIEALKRTYDGKKEHPKAHLEYPGSPQGAPLESGSSEPESAENSLNPGTSRAALKMNGHLAIRDEVMAASYLQPSVSGVGG